MRKNTHNGQIKHLIFVYKKEMHRPKTIEIKKQVDDLANQGLKHIEIAERLGIKLSKVHTLRMYPERVERARIYARKKREEQKRKPFAGLKKKITLFKKRAQYEDRCTVDFNLEDVIAKFGDSPKCYLTGLLIDWQDPTSYQLDHITPLSRGGSSNLDNLQISRPEANLMKRHYLPEEFISVCWEVVKYHADKIEELDKGQSLEVPFPDKGNK